MQVLDSIVDGVLDMACYDESAAGSLIIAILRYMRTGEEPTDLEEHVRSAWIMLLPVIQRSKSKADSGRKGGKANAKQTRSKPKANAKQPYESASSFASLSSSSSYSLSKEGVQGEETEAFEPPTEEACREYFETNFLKGDPSAFHDFYASQGWVKGNGRPVEDWRALARMWHRKQTEIDAERSAKGEPTAEEAKWKPAASADPKAEADRAQAEYERAVAKLTPEERRRFNLD